MITSNLLREGHSSRVRISRDSPAAKGAGLLTESVVMTDNLATVREKEIDRKLGYLSDMNQVDAALRHTLLLP